MHPEPTPPTPEASFAAFRRSGDAAALAAAFDATAPELLRIAAFLVARDDVEDLLHDTFGAALSRREAYDAARPLLPWLLGILANEARAVRRRARLRDRDRQTRGPAAERDPAAVASDHEAAEAFAQALQQLARDDATLLHQHLVDDLSCREIAERTKKPAGTVRTQVSRAMSELRRRLPVGLAAAPAFAVPDPCTLAAVRTRLLSPLPAMHAVLEPVVSAAGSIWWRWRWFLGSAAAVAAAVLLVLGPLAPDDDVAQPAAAATAEAPLPARAPDTAPRPPVADAGDRPEREPAVVTPPAWLLRGTVRASGGGPVPGAKVSCHLVEMGPVVASSLSDAEGRYELDLAFWRDRPPLDRAGYALVVVAQAPGTNSYTHLDALPRASAADGPILLTHDFELDSYKTLRGLAVDSDGRPVRANVHAIGLEAGEPLHAIATADEHGEFRLVISEDVARVRVDLRNAEAGRRRFEVELPAAGERDLGTIALERGHPLRGRVVLADGTPVPDCEVGLRGGLRTVDGLPQVGPDYWYFNTHTGADGRFVANRPTLETWAVRLMGPLGFTNDITVEERWIAGETDTVELRLDGARLDLTWSDPDGRELLPQNTRVVVFDGDAASAAAAARGGDPQALRLAVAESWLRDPHVVVPSGAHVWLQARAAGGFAVDRLLQAPRGGGAIAVDLRFAEVPAAPLVVRVRFADGTVPESFTCAVHPEPGASLRAFEEQQRQPGEARGTCAVGPVRIEVSAYERMWDDAVEHRSFVAQAGRENVVDVVLARRGRIRFVLRDVTDPGRTNDLDGTVTIGSVEAGRFHWADGDESSASAATGSRPSTSPPELRRSEYWGNPPLGRQVESMSMVPVGRHEVVFEFAGYERTSMVFDVREPVSEVMQVWLQPR